MDKKMQGRCLLSVSKKKLKNDIRRFVLSFSQDRRAGQKLDERVFKIVSCFTSLVSTLIAQLAAMCSEEHILLLFAFQNTFFFFFWSVTVPYLFDIRSVPILYLFRSRSHSRSVSVLYPVAFAFPVRFLLSGTVHSKPRLHVFVNPLFGVWPPCCTTPLSSSSSSSCVV